jgi:hypothetical protein
MTLPPPSSTSPTPTPARIAGALAVCPQLAKSTCRGQSRESRQQLVSACWMAVVGRHWGSWLHKRQQ